MARSTNRIGSIPSVGQVTPVPLDRIGLLGLILLANNASIWMIFSFLPFMVADFFPELSTTQLGFRAGILGSAFSAGSLVGNLVSGVLSDKFGRRPALMCGLAGTALSSLAFGFSPTFSFAVASRFMWGLLNGNIGVAKTYLAEISDDTNLAKGMALFGVIGGTGRIVGPIIGGFLSTPASHYPIFRRTIFDTFPFALPSIIISINCCFVLFVTYFILQETLPKWKQASKSRTKTSRPPKIRSGYSALNTSDDTGDTRGIDGDIELASMPNTARSNELVSVTSPNGSPEKGDRDSLKSFNSPTSDTDDQFHGFEESKEIVGDRHISSSETVSPMWGLRGSSEQIDRLVGGNNPARRVSFSVRVTVKELDGTQLQFMKLKQIGDSEMPLGTPSVVSNGRSRDTCSEEILRYSNGSEFYDSLENSRESFISKIGYLMRQRSIVISTALYGINAFANSVATEIFPLWVVTSLSSGGFNYDSVNIGTVSMAGGACSILLQLTLYPYLVALIGVLQVQRLGTILFAAICIVMPAISMVGSLNSKELDWSVILIGQVLQFTFVSWSLISLFVLISNSCYSHQRATVNGIGQTCASLGRMVGPYVAGSMFAWSENNGMGWPVNFYFTFYFAALVLVGSYILSCWLPRSIVRRKREPKVPQDYYLQLAEDETEEPATQTQSDLGLHRQTVTSNSNSEPLGRSVEDIAIGKPTTISSQKIMALLSSNGGYDQVPLAEDHANETSTEVARPDIENSQAADLSIEINSE